MDPPGSWACKDHLATLSGERACSFGRPPGACTSIAGKVARAAVIEALAGGLVAPKSTATTCPTPRAGRFRPSSALRISPALKI
jgi:hypothetical protein